MENREAINILRVINPPRESKRIFDKFMQARDMAITALEKQEADRWIPVTERLPEVRQRVLVQYKDGSMAVVKCNDAGHLTWFYARMVAWKPAPAPYQEDEV